MDSKPNKKLKQFNPQGLHVTASRGGYYIGSSIIKEHVRRSVAIVSLEGTKPSLMAVKLTYKVAAGLIDVNEAVAILARFYKKISKTYIV